MRSQYCRRARFPAPLRSLAQLGSVSRTAPPARDVCSCGLCSLRGGPVGAVAWLGSRAGRVFGSLFPSGARSGASGRICAARFSCGSPAAGLAGLPLWTSQSAARLDRRDRLATVPGRSRFGAIKFIGGGRAPRRSCARFRGCSRFRNRRRGSVGPPPVGFAIWGAAWSPRLG